MYIDHGSFESRQLSQSRFLVSIRPNKLNQGVGYRLIVILILECSLLHSVKH